MTKTTYRFISENSGREYLLAVDTAVDHGGELRVYDLRNDSDFPDSTRHVHDWRRFLRTLRDNRMLREV